LPKPAASALIGINSKPREPQTQSGLSSLEKQLTPTKHLVTLRSYAFSQTSL